MGKSHTSLKLKCFLLFTEYTLTSFSKIVIKYGLADKVPFSVSQSNLVSYFIVSALIRDESSHPIT